MSEDDDAPMTPIGASISERFERLRAAHARQSAEPEPLFEIIASEDRQQGCGICRHGLVQVRELQRSVVYACLCHRGLAKKRLRSIRDRMSAEAIRDLWPDGPPLVADRERVAQLLIDGRVPPKFLSWSLATYSERFKESREHQRYLRLASDWLKAAAGERSDLVIFGPNGTGKTGIAIAIARGLAELGEPCFFWTLRELSTAWRDTYRSDERRAPTAPSEQDLLNGLTEATLLIIDEIGGTQLSAFIEDTLTAIVDLRQKQQRPTILTLNLSGDQESIALEDGEILTRLLGATLQDRLRERGQFWPMKGQSRRRTFSRQQEP